MTTDTSTRPPARLSGEDASSWDTFDLKAMIPRGSGLCLDLGCGPGARQDLTRMGYDYLGLDRFDTAAADTLGTAERLPFRSASFDLVVAASSFEHFSDPWAAAREVHRILKPGGLVVASLSFLEPYHGHSYFHMSHLGASKLFNDSGLLVTRLEPFEWTGIEASLQMMCRMRWVRWLSTLLLRPVLGLRRVLIRRVIARTPDGPKKNRALEFLEEERFRFTAGIKLCAQKPPRTNQDERRCGY